MIPSFTQYLTEVGDRSYPYTWTHKEAWLWEGTFTTPNNWLYRVQFMAQSVPWPGTGTYSRPGQSNLVKAWTVEFALLSDGHVKEPYLRGIDPLGIVPTKGESFGILSTVMAMVREFVRNVHPPMLIFTAKENSRITLYTRATERVPQTLGLKGRGPLAPSKWGNWLDKWYNDETWFLWWDPARAPIDYTTDRPTRRVKTSKRTSA